MIINVFYSLLLIGGAALLTPKEKLSKPFSFAFFAAYAIMAFSFMEGMLNGQVSANAYSWLHYRKMYVDISLSSNDSSYHALLPFVLMTGCSLFINIFNREEKTRIGFVTAAVFNLAALFFLQGSTNLIQLLIGSYIISFWGIYVIDNLEAREKFVYYNLLADTFLFAAFSIVYGFSGNVELKSLPDFSRLGAHKDLVVFLLLFSVFIKSGLFLFQNQFFDIASIGYNRILLFLSCSAPAAGVLILQKTQALLAVSGYSEMLLWGFAGASMVYAVIAGLLLDNIKFRMVCFYMLMYGFAYAAAFSRPELNELLLCGYLGGLCLYTIYCASSNELYISKMGGFVKKMKFSFLLSLGWVPIFLQTADGFQSCGSWTWSWLAADMLLLSHLLHQVYFGKARADEMVWALLKNASCYLTLPLFLGLSGFIAFYPPADTKLLYWGMSAFVLLMLAAPFRALRQFSDNESLQEDDYFERLYDWVLMTPLRITGRLLWLLVDFLIIERTIMNSVTRGMGFLVNMSQKLHTSTILSYVLMTLLGTSVIILFWYKG